MPKIVLRADARMPDIPKVRFMRKNPEGSTPRYTDVTRQIARLEIEQLDEATGACSLLRRDAQGELIWRTKHQSLEETQWQAKFEYGTEVCDWSAAAE